MLNALYLTCIKNSVFEYEPLGPKNVEDIKKLKHYFRICEFRCYILYNYDKCKGEAIIVQAD